MDIKNTLANIVRNGGRLVGHEHAAEREAICLDCNMHGTVLLVYEGCMVCRCPRESKCATLTTINLIGQEKYEKCPHPNEGNKWVEIDKKFEENYKKNKNE